MKKMPGFTAAVSVDRNWSIDPNQMGGRLNTLSYHFQVIPQQLHASDGTIDPWRIPEDVEIFNQEFGECEKPGCDVCGGNVGEGDGLPVYGNWCGPGHGSGQPIDPVDAVCMAHDECYDERGPLDCSCDREMLERLPAAIADPRTSAHGKACGELARQWFSQSPCACRLSWCAPVPIFCEHTIPYPCWDWCPITVRIPFVGRVTVGHRPCNFRTCTETIQVPCGTATRCWNVLTGVGTGGTCFTPGLNVGGWWGMGR